MIPVVKNLDRIPSMNFFIFILFLFINLFKVDDDKIDTVYKNT